MTYLDRVDEAEHECPTPLERPADEFQVGGQVFSPAGRWETIREIAASRALAVEITTDRAVWRFWPSDRLPYLPDYRAGDVMAVRVFETARGFEVSVGRGRTGYGRGHVLASAHQVRGAGWEIADRPAGGGSLEHVNAPSKARARSEVNRRARAHAKRLGLPLEAGR